MLGKIFNRGKKNDFYLEINETEETSSTVEETEAKVETATEVEKVTESAPSPEATVEAVEAKTVSKPTTVKASKKPQKTQKGKSSTSTKKETGSKPAAPVAASASSWEQPFWVKAMYNNALSDSSQSKETETQPTFAPNYLLSQSSSRRRPGPSLNKFKDMARQKKF